MVSNLLGVLKNLVGKYFGDLHPLCIFVVLVTVLNVKRYRDQGSSQKRKHLLIVSELGQLARSLVAHMGLEKQLRTLILICKRAGRGRLGLAQAFDISKRLIPSPSDTSSKALLPNLSNSFKEFHSLVTKYSNVYTQKAILLRH